MDFHKYLTMTDEESAVPIENTVRTKTVTKVQNPFNSSALKAKMRQEKKSVEKTEPKWDVKNRIFSESYHA
jgi:hypothetical protein